MTRCIHCTRCVRFGQEIAGVMELGMAGRGEHSEIMSFVGRTVDSELSGNMIDLCPVGALTSKPFRYRARTWELSRRKSVAPHDSLGSNVVVQVKGQEVVRVLPLENEAVNECWLSDRDRFSYEGLNSDDRLTMPMVNEGGTWREVDWPTALERVAAGLRERRGAARRRRARHARLAAGDARGAGAGRAPHARAGVGERRLSPAPGRTCAPSGAGARWLGMPVAEIQAHDRILVVGSFLRNDQPLFAHRIRQAAKKRAHVLKLSSVDDDWLMPVAAKSIVAAVAAARGARRDRRRRGRCGRQAGARGAREPRGDAAGTRQPSAIADDLAGGSRRAILLGSLAEQHPQACAAARAGAGARGADRRDAGLPARRRERRRRRPRRRPSGRGRPGRAGDARGAAPRLRRGPRRSRVRLREPRGGTARVRARGLRRRAERLERPAPPYADVLLPIAPFTETSGHVRERRRARAELPRRGRARRGQARPGWKVLRVLGTMLGLPGFDADDSQAVRDERRCPPTWRRGSTTAPAVAIEAPARTTAGVERVADVPLYFADPLVRRSAPLQQTRDARPPLARMHRSLLESLGIAEGAQVRVRQGRGEAVVKAAVDPAVPPGVVRLGAAHRLDLRPRRA